MKKLAFALALLPLLLPPSAAVEAREVRRAAVQAPKVAKPELRLVSRSNAAPARQIGARALRPAAAPARMARPMPGSRAEASCTRRQGRLVCTRGDSIAGWFRDLAPADHAQQDCPAGTFAIHARGHEDVLRCMPI